MIHVSLPKAAAFLFGAALNGPAQGLQPALQELPEYGVLFTGSPEVPVIGNHSGRTIIGFDMSTYTVDGGKGPGAGSFGLRLARVRTRFWAAWNCRPSVVSRSIPACVVLVYLRSAAIMDGAQYQPPFSGTRLPIVKAVLNGVLFDTGEYVGIDDWFFAVAPLRLNIYREMGKQLTAVKYGSDAEIAAVWSKLEEMVTWRHDPSRQHLAFGIDPGRRSAALNLLQERDLHGERLAFDLAEYYSSLPVPWRKN